MSDLSIPKPISPYNPSEGSNPPAPQSSGAASTVAAEQAQQNSQQAAKEANKAAETAAQDSQEAAQQAPLRNANTQLNLQQAMQKALDKPMSLSVEVLTTVETIVQEGFENYKVPQTSEGAGVYGDTRKDFQKDLQVVREFLREATRLIKQQGMEVSQMIHWIKADQGGVLWQRLQQVLQKGLPNSEGEMDQSAGKMRLEGRGALGSGLEKEKIGQGATPGKALLEILKGEGNPTNALESLMVALQMLKESGMQKSSDKLIGYLKRRYNLSDEDMHQLMQKYHIAYWQGPMPRGEKEIANLWYPFLALLCTPIAMLCGVDFLKAGALGMTLTAVVFFAVQIRKS